MKRFHTSAIVLLTVLAAASALFGLREMQTFDSTPGEAGVVTAVWPRGVPVARTPGRATLLLFAHPLCSCTKASIAELERVLAQAAVMPDVRVFFEPEGERKPQLWGPASSLPNATIAWDTDGVLAARFGARTSGMIELFDAAGHLQFKGGITLSRGHEGQNPGSDALLSAIRGNNRSPATFPVFGCALRGESL